MYKHSSTPQKGSDVIFKALGFLRRDKKSLSVDKDIVVPSSEVMSKAFDITQWYEYMSDIPNIKIMVFQHNFLI